jgi:hypothetical protein
LAIHHPDFTFVHSILNEEELCFNVFSFLPAQHASVLDQELGWEFQFSVPISGTPIVSGIPIPFSIPKIPVGFFF